MQEAAPEVAAVPEPVPVAAAAAAAPAQPFSILGAQQEVINGRAGELGRVAGGPRGRLCVRALKLLGAPAGCGARGACLVTYAPPLSFPTTLSRGAHLPALLRLACLSPSPTWGPSNLSLHAPAPLNPTPSPPSPAPNPLLFLPLPPPSTLLPLLTSLPRPRPP